DLNRAQQVVPILTGVRRKRFCKLPLSLCPPRCVSSNRLLSVLIARNGFLKLLREIRIEIRRLQPPVISVRGEHIRQTSTKCIVVHEDTDGDFLLGHKRDMTAITGITAVMIDHLLVAILADLPPEAVFAIRGEWRLVSRA